MNSKFICILLMGVAGCGKTSVGLLLAKKINAFFIEADNFHGEANINKMSSGKPLNDEDRYDWLLKINKEITKRKNKQNLVVACSSLKESYRDLLGKNNFKLVYLKINKELASIRINSRTDHFMPSTLVDSQFMILEEPNDALVFNQDLTEIQIVNEIIIKLDLKLY